MTMQGTVLITGAYGFLGRNVAKHFAGAGWFVVGMGHGSWARDEWRQWGIAEWHTADITTDALLTYAGTPEVIVHCAGSGSVGFSMTHPQQDFQRTVDTTVAVLEFVRLHAPRARVVYPSSAGVYGVVEKLPIAESAPLAPISPYGVHKKIAEQMCSAYAAHFGVSVAVIRLFSVYGIGLRKQLLWDACMKIRDGANTFFGSGTETRDWLHVNDAAALMLAATRRAGAECPVFNGGSGQGVSVREVLGELFDCFGRSDTPQFSGALRGGDPVHYIADMGRTRDWDWRPDTSWRAGVREYAEWFKKEMD
jgi:UDP-glucose 4-epimerase